VRGKVVRGKAVRGVATQKREGGSTCLAVRGKRKGARGKARQQRGEAGRNVKKGKGGKGKS